MWIRLLLLWHTIHRIMNLRTSLLFGLLAFVFVACSDDDEPNGTDYTVPATYDFQNVDYSGQTTRLDMLGELTAELKKGNTQGTTVDATLLKNMFSNTNNPFSSADLNGSGKQLKDKTFANVTATFEAWMDRHGEISQSTTAASEGVAGVVGGLYLVDTNGVEYIQLIEKGLFGACFYYQIANEYTTADRIGAGVTELADRQHHWDEAFGYVGIPTDWDLTDDQPETRYIGNYSADRDALTGCAANIYAALREGRAAIDNGGVLDGNETVDQALQAAKDKLLTNIEIGLGATAIHYINDAIASFADDAVRNHVLSEAVAFIWCLQFSPSATYTTAEVNTLLGNFTAGGTFTTAADFDFYGITTTQLNAVKTTLATDLGLTAVADQL